VQFFKIWQTVDKHSSSFSREICKTSFLAAVKQKFKKNRKNCLSKVYFFVFKIRESLVAMYSTEKILENFTEGNSKQSQIKP